MRFVLFEVNEVPYAVWDRFAEKHPDSTVARLLENGAQTRTRSDDEGFVSLATEGSGRAQLTPWTTWPTVHRGVTNQHHRILDLGQDLASADLSFPPVWQIAIEAGRSVGVFGSLHSYPPPSQCDGVAFHVPDPFAPGDETIPAVAESFQAFSLGATRASGRNVAAGVDLGAAAKFIVDAPRLGVRVDTLARIVRQLVTERRTPERVTRRRAIQSEIGFDLFMKLLTSSSPDLSTFFCNHVAAAMHRYWAAAYPDDYDDLDVPAEWIDAYGDEIDAAMSVVDRMLRRLVEHCDEQADLTLVVASSMGQAPTKGQLVQTELAVEDPERFFAALGVAPGQWTGSASMFPNVNVTVDGGVADELEASLRALVIDGARIDYRRADHGFFSIDVGHPNLASTTVSLRGVESSLSELGLVNLPIQDLSMKCADHVRHGSLIAYGRTVQPDHRRAIVSTCAIAPALLAGMGVPVPEYMTVEPVAGVPSATLVNS